MRNQSLPSIPRVEVRPLSVRERRDDLQPASLVPRDIPGFARHLGQNLILAEYHCNVDLALTRQSHHVETEPEVDSRLPLYPLILRRAVRKTDPFDPVAQPPRGHGNPGAAHCGQTPRPVTVPHRRPRGSKVAPIFLLDSGWMEGNRRMNESSQVRQERFRVTINSL